VRHLRHLPSREGEEAHFLNRQRALFVIAGAAVLVAAALRIPLCPFALLAGLPCPGCGLSRATLALLRGDVRTAMALHPLVLLAAPAILLGVLHATSAETSRGRERAMATGACTLLVLFVAVWLARFAGFFGGPVGL
jgi:hypothetical protein